MPKMSTAAVVLLAIGSVHLFAQGRNEIKADGYLLMDGKNRLRAFMGLTGGDQSYTHFYLSDSKGRPRFQISVAPDESRPEIILIDTQGNRVSALGATRRIDPLSEPDNNGKAEAARATDIRLLQRQIDQLRGRLNQVISEINQR